MNVYNIMGYAILIGLYFGLHTRYCVYHPSYVAYMV